MRLHPELAEMLRKRAALNLTPYHAGTPRQARLSYAAMQALLPANRGAAMHSTEERSIPVKGGNIAVRLFRPTASPAPGKILYLHGGGWVIGTLDGFSPVCRELAAATNMTVASVDYRLAPEHPFPGPVEDAYAALEWANENLSGPLVVMGDSAGANLSAAIALKARAENGPAIALQVLVYPVTDADFSRPSYVELGTGAYQLTVEDMAWFWSHYVPDPAERRHPLAAPLHAQDPSGLPPAIVIVAGCDPLRDEGLAYAKRLTEAGVPTQLEMFDDMIHGFFTMVDLIGPANAAVRRIGKDIAARVAALSARSGAA
jgi:acetyl esterase